MMMDILKDIFGRMTLDQLPHDVFRWGGALSIIGGLLAVVALITFMKRWRWLWTNWITTLDHKKIGIMYLIVAGIMLLRGAGDAVMMRVQQTLASGDMQQGILTSDHFQQVFTAHGTIMIFFVAMGLMFGLINLLLPLQLGSRDVAFPFLNAVSFWLFFAGMMLVNASLVIGDFAATGWLAYPPLSELEYSPGTGVDYWLWSIQISGIGSLLSGINFLATIAKMRRAGMKLMTMPIFAWSVACAMILVVFAFPVLTATLGMLSLDRLMGMHFFTSDAGGNPMMYINLIWAWGHPEVYILILPAFGIFSEIVATFSRKVLFGYKTMVWALISITLLSFIVWLHHFFTMGAGSNVNAFFGIATMVIAIPTGVKIFNWLFTMYRGKIVFASPMLWFMAFVMTFTIGGITGIILAVPSIDFQVHNSLFLVAHFHNTIIGGVVFGYFAGIAYWFPKMFGYKLDERFGKLAIYCWSVGFLLAFVPLYILGMMGATRRVDHVDPSLGWQPLFLVSALGVFVIMLGVLCQIIQIILTVVRRKQYRCTDPDPWNGRTLEWTTASPAPVYNFATMPAVQARDDWWRQKQNTQPAKQLPLQAIELPKNTSFGFMIGMAAFMIGFGLIWHMWWLAIVGLCAVVGIVITMLSRESHEYTVTPSQITALENAHKKERA